MILLKAPISRAPTKPGDELRMTEAEYIEWSGEEGVRSEWVNGEVVIMNAVAGDHADLTTFIMVLVGAFVASNDLGKVWTEPFQMRLPNQRRRRSPDLFYASSARLHLFEKTQFNGAPDLVVEIISPDSQNRDRREKFLEYQNAGVKEYWIPDPISRTFDAFAINSAGKYDLIPADNGQIHSRVLTGLFFRTEWVWQLKLPNPVTLVQQMTRNRKKLLSSRKRRSSDNPS